jgi:hypothetical protein
MNLFTEDEIAKTLLLGYTCFNCCMYSGDMKQGWCYVNTRYPAADSFCEKFVKSGSNETILF